MGKLVTVLMVVLTAVFMMPRAAFAQNDRGNGFPTFDSLDKNKDGKITQDEFAGPPQFFSRFDTNGDGSITKEEMDATVQNFRNRGAGRNFDPAQMRERQLESTKTALGSTDDEWKAIQPLVEKVLDARTKLRSTEAGRGFRPGGSNDRGGQRGNSNAAPQVTDLEKTLQNTGSSQDEISAKLAALRKARGDAQKELTDAQNALREVLTVRQEATLVLMGTLD